MKEEKAKGNWLGSGKRRLSAIVSPSDSAATQMTMRRGRRRAASDPTTTTPARKAAATGLESAQAAAAARASFERSSWRARIEASPKATPRAKVNWPSASSVTTPTANQSVAQRAAAPQRSRTRRSKR